MEYKPHEYNSKFEFPKCKKQREFEDLTIELITIMSNTTEKKQLAIFEYAQNIIFNKPD